MGGEAPYWPLADQATPSPGEGEGWGEGDVAGKRVRLSDHPSPQPSPPRGERERPQRFSAEDLNWSCRSWVVKLRNGRSPTKLRRSSTKPLPPPLTRSLPQPAENKRASDGSTAAMRVARASLKPSTNVASKSIHMAIDARPFIDMDTELTFSCGA